MKTEQSLKEQAAQIWATFNDSERFGVSFGLFPQAKMPTPATEHEARRLAVALMDLAKGEAQRKEKP